MDAKDIANIRFGIMSPDEIRRIAVCKIDNPAKSGMGSVYDERMGYNPESNNLCTTCGLKKCPGHFGYIELNHPIVHPMFFKLISSFLKCFCKNCHHLLLSAEQIELKGLHRAKGRKRFNAILKECEKVDICIRSIESDRKNDCKNCNTSQHKITYKPTDNQGTFYEEPRAKSAKKDKRALTVDDIKLLFDQISDEDVTLLGLDPQLIHPRNLILTVLPVIPPCSRPPVKQDGKICDDDLTCQLEEIIKKNNFLIDPNKAKERESNLSHLIFRIQCLMNNSGGKLKHPTAHRAVNSLKERLSGKRGRIRGNLMGKRVNFSARTVIGAEPTLKLNELGIPEEIARIHTKPENVTKYNIDWLTDIVNAGKADGVITTKGEGDAQKKVRLNVAYALMKKGTELIQGDIIVRGPCLLQRDEKGKIIIPEREGNFGGITIIPVVTRTEKLEPGDQLVRNGELVEVTFPIHRKISLKIGDIVERQLMKGDIVLFNRQPTLHKGSMLALEVVPMPHKTFRFNLAATKSFNGDFDGDMHKVMSIPL